MLARSLLFVGLMTLPALGEDESKPLENLEESKTKLPQVALIAPVAAVVFRARTTGLEPATTGSTVPQRRAPNI